MGKSSLSIIIVITLIVLIKIEEKALIFLSERPKQALSDSVKNIILQYLVQFSINFDETMHIDLTFDFKENLFYNILL